MGLLEVDWPDGYGAGAVKYGLEASESLVESGEFCRGLVDGDLGRVRLKGTKCR